MRYYRKCAYTLFLVVSGGVRLVASKDERGQIPHRAAGYGPKRLASDHEESGEEIGADLILIGTVNSIRDEIAGTAVMFYQVNLELVSTVMLKSCTPSSKKRNSNNSLVGVHRFRVQKFRSHTFSIQNSQINDSNFLTLFAYGAAQGG